MQHSHAVYSAKANPSFLIVEDSLFDQKRIERILKHSYKNVPLQYASTLKEAHQILARTNVSLILLDNNLPDGQGANYVRVLATDPKLVSIPVIIISDWPSPFMWDKAQSAGVKFVLTKDEFHAGYVQKVLSNENRLTRMYN